ncbi:MULTISPECIES: Bax inhibitor-1/YccA family protein [unclassified Aeromicrobium]|uniref:Bax inhibitor-1/YccA family protein n=1 Tax=unclassified Aeromicrobium TaxID=2633570 RepID=UPI00288A0F18|nr:MULTISPECIES: Bax inhibitor-1/YccA family protein [unclassified Aeromicrobium]
MQSNNPVFNRSEGFNGRGTSTARATDPSQWKLDLDGSTSQPGPTHTSTGRGTGLMTLETVIEKTAISLALVVVAAAATWFVTGDVASGSAEASSNLGLLSALMMVGMLGGLALSLVNSFKKVVSPPLVLAYAVLEGVFLGAASKLISYAIAGTSIVVVQAVVATFVAAGATLAAYKFFDIQVTDRMRKIGAIMAVSILGVLVVNLVLSLTGVVEGGGLAGFDTLGLIVSVAIAAFAVYALVLDFDMVERGVEAGLPESESWRAAFGLTVTLTLLYFQLLRIFAILSQD